MDQLFVSSVLLNAWDVRSVAVGVVSVQYLFSILCDRKKEHPKTTTLIMMTIEHCIIMRWL